jgi:glutathione synthase/RimK-type ligase-like ATP-grasp enzyme
MPLERGYFLVQEFLPGNSYDTRVTVIGDRAFAFTRDVRANDFRASGRGSINYDFRRIDMRCIEIAFDVANRTRAQSMAFDFAVDSDGRPLILEVSYAYMARPVFDCSGYWDSKLQWHPGNVWPQDAILEDMLARF